MSHFGPGHVENSITQLFDRTQKRMESLIEFRHAVRKLAKPAYPYAGTLDRLAKNRFVESIPNPQCGAKLRDLRPAILNEVLDEACMQLHNWENET